MRIEATNFLSWKNLEFVVEDGITIIDGFNEDDGTSEGSGKSAILNALCFGIYGKLPKDVKVNEVIRTGQKSCSVTVCLDDGTTVIRKRGPADLCILQKGTLIKGKDAKETQKMIEEIVGLSFDAFCQSVYFPQNYTKKFISSNQEDKAKILSEIQNLELFNKSRKACLAKEKECEEIVKTTAAEIEHIRRRFKDFQNNIESHNQSIATVHQAIAKDKEYINQEIEGIKRKRDTLVGEKASIEERLSKAKEERKSRLHKDIKGCANFLKTEISELNEQFRAHSAKAIEKTNKLSEAKDAVYVEINESESTVRRLQRSIEDLERQQKTNVTKAKQLSDHATSSVCPTCGQSSKLSETQENELKLLKIHIIEDETKLEKLKGTIEAAKKVVEKQRQDLEALSDANVAPDTKSADISFNIAEKERLLKKAEAEEKEFDEIEDRITQDSRELLTFDAKIEMLIEPTKKLRDKLDNYDDSCWMASIESYKKKIVEAQKEKNEMQKTMREHSKKSGASDELRRRYQDLKAAFKDIRLYVFNNVIEDINFKTNFYLQQLFDIPVQIKFVGEDNKIETELSIGGQERSLGLLSGGQFRRFSLAVDLALSDVVKERRNSQFPALILDEYFKDLSEYSMTKCLDLLKNRKQPVLLIEHNSVFKSAINRVRTIRYSSGVSEWATD